MPRPWHRFPLFYLGLFPLLFLFWAWWDSFNYASTASKNWIFNSDPCYFAEATHSWGAIRIRHERFIGTLSFPVTTLSTHRRPLRLDTEDPWTLPRIDIKRSQQQIHPLVMPTEEVRIAITLPHWLLILAYLALWSLLFFWRSRRRKRIITPAQPQPD